MSIQPGVNVPEFPQRLISRTRDRRGGPPEDFNAQIALVLAERFSLQSVAMKRLLKWLLVFAGLGLAGFAWYLWLGPTGGINRMTALRIKMGMTHEEVDAVIGLRCGDHCSTPDPGTLVAARGNARFWYGDAGEITVWFDDDGKVTNRSFSPSVPSFFDKVYQWVGVDKNNVPLPSPSRPFFVDDQP
jgi:hypothetical protein